MPRDGNQLGTTVKPGKLEVLDIDDTSARHSLHWTRINDELGFASLHISDGMGRSKEKHRHRYRRMG